MPFMGAAPWRAFSYDGTPYDWMKVTVEDGNYPFKDTQIGTVG